MKDRYFYPLAAVIIGAMIAYALSFTVDTRPSNVDIFERQGADLDVLFPSPGTTVNLEVSSDMVYAKLSAHMNREIAPPSAGVFATLGPDYESNFGGATIRITVRAKAGETTPSATMELGYFTADVGSSGWRTFELADSYADYSFDYSPNKPSGKGNNYLGIWPDSSGQGSEVFVQSVKVERLRP